MFIELQVGQGQRLLNPVHITQVAHTNTGAVVHLVDGGRIELSEIEGRALVAVLRNASIVRTLKEA